MEIKEIRDKLVEKRTNYQNAVKAAEEASLQIKSLLGEITVEDSQKLRESGFNPSILTNIDIERCKIDKEYLENCKSELEDFAKDLQCYLEEKINVPN